MLSQGTISSRPECLLSSESVPHEGHPRVEAFYPEQCIPQIRTQCPPGPSAGHLQRGGRDRSLVPHLLSHVWGWSCTSPKEEQRRQGTAENAHGDYCKNKIKWKITPFPTHPSKLDGQRLYFLPCLPSSNSHPPNCPTMHPSSIKSLLCKKDDTNRVTSINCKVYTELQSDYYNQT